MCWTEQYFTSWPTSIETYRNHLGRFFFFKMTMIPAIHFLLGDAENGESWPNLAKIKVQRFSSCGMEPHGLVSWQRNLVFQESERQVMRFSAKETKWEPLFVVELRYGQWWWSKSGDRWWWDMANTMNIIFVFVAPDHFDSLFSRCYDFQRISLHAQNRHLFGGSYPASAAFVRVSGGFISFSAFATRVLDCVRFVSISPFLVGNWANLHSLWIPTFPVRRSHLNQHASRKHPPGPGMHWPCRREWT